MSCFLAYLLSATASEIRSDESDLVRRLRDYWRVRVREGQLWEVRRGAAPDDPLVVEVLEVNEQARECRVRTYLSSAPGHDLGRRRWEWCSTIADMGVLVAGPGAPDATERRAQVEHARQLLLYAARHEGRRYRRGIAVRARPLQEMLTADLRAPTYARMVLREAIGLLGGIEDDVLVEESRWGKQHELCYVLPHAQGANPPQRDAA